MRMRVKFQGDNYKRLSLLLLDGLPVRKVKVRVIDSVCSVARLLSKVIHKGFNDYVAVV